MMTIKPIVAAVLMLSMGEMSFAIEMTTKLTDEKAHELYSQFVKGTKKITETLQELDFCDNFIKEIPKGNWPISEASRKAVNICITLGRFDDALNYLKLQAEEGIDVFDKAKEICEHFSNKDIKFQDFLSDIEKIYLQHELDALEPLLKIHRYRGEHEKMMDIYQKRLMDGSNHLAEVKEVCSHLENSDEQFDLFLTEAKKAYKGLIRTKSVHTKKAINSLMDYYLNYDENNLIALELYVLLNLSADDLRHPKYVLPEFPKKISTPCRDILYYVHRLLIKMSYQKPYKEQFIWLLELESRLYEKFKLFKVANKYNEWVNKIREEKRDKRRVILDIKYEIKEDDAVTITVPNIIRTIEKFFEITK